MSALSSNGNYEIHCKSSALVFLALWLPAAAQHAAAMQDHWRVVREVWTELFAENASIRLKPDVDGQTLHEAMAGQAERLSEARPLESELLAKIRALIDRYRIPEAGNRSARR